MTSYADIRKSSRAAHAKAYANGGRVKSAKTVINVVVPPASGGQQAPAAPIAGMGPGPMASPPSGPPASAIPPAAANAALGAMGGAPAFASGGRVPAGKVPGKLAAKAGTASGQGRLKQAKKLK